MNFLAFIAFGAQPFPVDDAECFVGVGFGVVTVAGTAAGDGDSAAAEVELAEGVDGETLPGVDAGGPGSAAHEVNVSAKAATMRWSAFRFIVSGKSLARSSVL